jgi:hypothetical protein
MRDVLRLAKVLVWNKIWKKLDIIVQQKSKIRQKSKVLVLNYDMKTHS